MKYILLFLLILPLMLIPTYADSQFTDEDKKLIFQETTKLWINGTLTNEEYVTKVKSMTDNFYLYVNSHFNLYSMDQFDERQWNALKNDANLWINNSTEKTDDQYADDLESLAYYGFLGNSRPYYIVGTFDKKIYNQFENKTLTVDFGGVPIQEKGWLELEITKEGKILYMDTYKIDTLPLTIEFSERDRMQRQVGEYVVEMKYDRVVNYVNTTTQFSPAPISLEPIQIKQIPQSFGVNARLYISTNDASGITYGNVINESNVSIGNFTIRDNSYSGSFTIPDDIKSGELTIHVNDNDSSDYKIINYTRIMPLNEQIDILEKQIKELQKIIASLK